MTSTSFADEIAPVNRRFSDAIGAGDAASAAHVYTQDAVLMPPGMPSMQGRDAIQQFWQGGIQQGIKSATLKSEGAESSGEMGYEVGAATLQIGTPDGQTITQVAKYTVVWKREGGEWRWHVDIWNTNE